MIEHNIERRPFLPDKRVRDKDWRRLWARLSRDLPWIKSPTDLPDLSKYYTYPPNPDPLERSLLQDNPWDKLEIFREWFWDREMYHFRRIFLKEDLIDSIRYERENEEDDRRVREELEAIRAKADATADASAPEKHRNCERQHLEQ